jgi:hypothetical protein
LFKIISLFHNLSSLVKKEDIRRKLIINTVTAEIKFLRRMAGTTYLDFKNLGLMKGLNTQQSLNS